MGRDAAKACNGHGVSGSKGGTSGRRFMSCEDATRRHFANRHGVERHDDPPFPLGAVDIGGAQPVGSYCCSWKLG
jgi:hypothetical protein